MGAESAAQRRVASHIESGPLTCCGSIVAHRRTLSLTLYSSSSESVPCKSGGLYLAYLNEMEFRFENRKNPHLFRDTMKRMLTADNIEFKQLTATTA